MAGKGTAVKSGAEAEKERATRVTRNAQQVTRNP